MTTRRIRPFDWNETIGYAHVDPNEYWLQRKSPPKGIPKANAKRMCYRVDSQALSPTRGWLRDRLAPGHHMPVMASGNHVCQLYQWAHKEFNPNEPDNVKPKGSRTQVMRCRECNVHLCLPCFEIYHTKERLCPMIPTILGLPNK